MQRRDYVPSKLVVFLFSFFFSVEINTNCNIDCLSYVRNVGLRNTDL
jgi:hypothetical protein